jgi:uncharacterized protein YndB with AHSA1/START domain
MTEPGIHRHLELDVDLDELWQLVTDPDELATWLGDEVELEPVPGGAGRVVDDDVERHVRVDHVVEGERIEWTWWPGDDPDAASRVEIVVSPRPGGSRLDVIETLETTRSRAVTPTASCPSRWDVRTTLMAFASSGARVTCRSR